MFNNFNPYNPYYQQQRFQYQPQPQMYNQDQQNSIYRQSTPQGLQGKVVDNIEVVKAMDIPLDGSTSYFAIADGSAIVTKQLQQDGTSNSRNNNYKCSSSVYYWGRYNYLPFCKL